MGFFLHVLTITCTSIPSILGYNLVFGKGKVMHFGPMAVSLVAAYGTFIPVMSTGSYAVGIAIGLLCTALFSALLAFLSLRLEADAFGVLSIALHFAVQAVVLNWRSLTRGALGIPKIPRMPFLETNDALFLASLLVAVLWVAFMWWIHRHAVGRALAALGEHRWHAMSVGVSGSSIYVIAFLIAGLGSFLTNLLFTQYIAILHPSDFAFTYLIFMIMVIIAGRPGSVFGVLISILFFTFIREGIRFLPLAPALVGPLRLMTFGVILLMAVWLRRHSIFPPERRV